VRLGEFVEEGQPLYRVTAMRPLRAQIRVPELAARRIARGDPVALRALDGREVQGRVARIAPTIDPASGTVEVLVDVPDPRGLPPGATVSARFIGD
jgi:multidrug efflux pump subunit AcrA (membrane-fusion protein)